MNRRVMIRHETSLLKREAAGWVVFALLVICVVYAWSNGNAFREQRTSDVAVEVATAGEHLAAEKAAVSAGEPGGFSGRAGSVETVATAPAGILSDFTIGQAELYPYRADISPFRRLDDLFRNYQLQSPLTLLSGRFDLSFVVVYLLPLLIIALSYNLLSSERELGTLPIALTQPITVRELLDAKLLARVALILGPFTMLVGAAFLASGDLSQRRVLLFLLWLATALVYGLFWVAVAAWVSAWGRGSEANAVILACLWLMLVVVLPGILNVVINGVAPSPSRLGYVTEMRSATATASQRSADLLANYYEDHPELAAEEMQGGFLPAYFAQQREIERKVQPIVDDFESKLEQQQRLVRISSILSPAVLLQEAFNDIAGTGLGRQRNFTGQARAFLTQWHETLRPKMFTAAVMTVDDYDRLPTFSFEEEPLGAIVGRSIFAFIVLLLPTVLLTIWARRRVLAFSPAS